MSAIQPPDKRWLPVAARAAIEWWSWANIWDLIITNTKHSFRDPVAVTTNHPLTVHAVVRFRVMPVDLRSVKASVSMECGSSSRVFFKKPSLIFAPRNGFDDEPSFIKPRQVSAFYNNNLVLIFVVVVVAPLFIPGGARGARRGGL